MPRKSSFDSEISRDIAKGRCTMMAENLDKYVLNLGGLSQYLKRAEKQEYDFVILALTEAKKALLKIGE